MEYKDLREINENLRTIDVKGKDYVEVNTRVDAFRRLFPNGTIATEMLACEGGVCVFKAVAKDGETVLGTGHAYEKEGSTFINKTSYIENCVPLDTQILTSDGWKYYYQVSEGDQVLSLNMATGAVEYTGVTRINTYRDRPLVEMSTSRFKATCTPEHKWIAETQYKPIQKIVTNELTSAWRIVQAVPQNVEGSKLGKMLGWLMCDCEITRAGNGLPSTAYINQSKYVEEITELFGEGRQTSVYNEGWKKNYEWVIPAKTVREVLGVFNVASYKDLIPAMLAAPIEDVKGCFDAVMLADGEGCRRFSSTYKELVEAVQIMCVRLGIATTFITSREMKNSTKPLFSLGIKSTKGAYFSEMEVKNIPPRDVWCPTTENGTWFMRQGSFVTLTSNCETSAVGRALGFVGIGIDASIASYEEVENAKANQNKGSGADKGTLVNRIVELIELKGVDREEICKRGGVKDIKDMPPSQMEECINWLKGM